ncbi:MAG: hypothetical protein JXR94_12395, partial [Candidatus Hydrogenedentes bacterium]|nr:hypothetical protein [Candidatus Hydrogenedentota bacterium]
MPNRPSTNRLRHVSLLIVLPVAIGCARLHGEPVHRQPIGPDGPRVSVILDDLASNDEAITSFLAKGSCILESPEFAGKKRFRGQVAFRKPGDLSIKGRQRVTNILLFDLTCVDDEFLLDFPADNQRYYRFKGFESPDVEFSVSPLDVV